MATGTVGALIASLNGASNSTSISILIGFLMLGYIIGVIEYKNELKRIDRK